MFSIASEEKLHEAFCLSDCSLSWRHYFSLWFNFSHFLFDYWFLFGKRFLFFDFYWLRHRLRLLNRLDFLDLF